MSISAEANEARGEAITSTADHQARVSAELDVFSGRPNPTWDLPDAQVRELLRMLQDAQTSRAERPLGGVALGYRGLVLKITSDSHVDTWRVSNGSIEFNGQFFNDGGRRIEAYVVRTMPDGMRSQFTPLLPGLLP